MATTSIWILSDIANLSVKKLTEPDRLNDEKIDEGNDNRWRFYWGLPLQLWPF